jgi:hypothetical protein
MAGPEETADRREQRLGRALGSARADLHRAMGDEHARAVDRRARCQAPSELAGTGQSAEVFDVVLEALAVADSTVTNDVPPGSSMRGLSQSTRRFCHPQRERLGKINNL